jgi:hypothetical protein
VALWFWIGHPFAFLTGQDVWERHWSWFGPFGGIAAAVGDGDYPELGYAALMVALAVVAWQRTGAAYGLYALLALALPMSFPSTRLGGLYSFPRLALAAFPCFLAAGSLLADRPRATAAISLASATLLVVYVVRWSLWQWIA